MKTKRPMTRWRASALHLTFSILVAASVTAMILLVWYPGLYYKASGADHLFVVLMSVDVVVGPLLTLLLYRHGKPGLMFDLTTILVLQIAALVYGLSVIIGSRPVFLVGAIDRFVAVSANQIDPNDLPNNPASPYRQMSLTGPRLVGFELPEKVAERDQLLFDELAGKRAEMRPQLYRPYAEVSAALVQRAKPVDSLLRRPDPDGALARAWVEASARPGEQLVWLPLQARKRDMVMMMDRQSGQPLGMLDIDPW
ncbi:MAG: hypothetical protein JNL89_10000 [Rhodanobacteraceae bacterium]|jgi:hypothetical protein|nr:hypothetical protein [Rhodanobacteraceae bacterium]